MSARQDIRISTSISVVLTTGDESAVCLTKNISRRGALIRTDLTLSAGDILQVDIVRRTDHIALRARVASVSPAGLGVAFENVDPANQERMRVLMAELHVGAATGRGEIANASVRFEVQWAWWDDFVQPGVWEGISSRRDPVVSLSQDGAALVTEHKPAVGEVIGVRVTYPEDSTSMAAVVRLTDDGFAVRWVRPPAAFQRALGLVMTGMHHTNAPPPAAT